MAVVKLIPEKEEENTESTFETIKVLELDSDDLKTVNVTNKNGSFKLYSEAEKQEDSSSSSGILTAMQRMLSTPIRFRPLPTARQK